MSNRTRWTALVAGAAVLAAVAGCGIAPTSPQRIDDGLVAEQALSAETQQIQPPPPVPGTPTQTVSRYFEAAVGGGEAAVKNVQAYFTPAGRGKWTPSQQLTIVRILRIDEGARSGRTVPVTARYQRVGVLTDQGIFDDIADQPQSFTFTLVADQDNPNQWQIDSGPQGLLLSDSALDHYYRPRPVYFWDANHQSLVPDLRYVSLTTAPVSRPNTLVDWLLNGPSRWLSGAVVALPASAERRSAVVKNSAGELVVNLSAPAGAGDAGDLQRLVDQLRWSLRTDTFPAVELQIEGQHKTVDGTSDRYLAANAAAKAALDAPAVAERFGVVDGKLVPLGSSPAMSVLSSTANRSVVSAALARGPDRAAFVRRRGDGSLSLSIQQSTGAKLPPPVQVNIGRVFRMSRPAWIPGAIDRLLVAAGGHIYVVTGAGGPTDVTPDGVTSVTALSVAPEGRRIAFVAQGRAYVAPLVVSDSTVSVYSQRRPLVPGQLDAEGVAWTSEDAVLVAGSSGGKAALWRVRADGAVAEDQSPNETGLIDVIAYPQSPARSTLSVEAMVQTSTVAYNLYGRSLSAEPGVLWPCYAF